jgi:hypothetical protein
MKHLTAALAAAFLWVAPWGAEAAVPCMARDDLVGYLTSKFSETKRAIGLAGLKANPRVVEFFASDAGTWTILMTDSRGLSCMVFSGERLEWIEAVPEPEGDPS